MFSESVTSSLHQEEMRLQKKCPCGKSGQEESVSHHPQSSELWPLPGKLRGVTASPHPLPRWPADLKVSRALCLLCVRTYSYEQNAKLYKLKIRRFRISLVVLWLGLCAANAGGKGSIPSQGTNISAC